MRREVAEILRENGLTYMRDGREVFTHIEEVEDGKRVVTRPDVPLALTIEEGYEDLGVRQLVDPEGNKQEGFKRPKGKALGMQICDCFPSCGGIKGLIDTRIAEMKHRVYIGILLSVCKHYIRTDNKICIGVEWMGNFCYVKGWLMVD